MAQFNNKALLEAFQSSIYMDPQDFIDYYSLLEIDQTATASQIKKAYRAKSLLYHPDKQGGSDALFHALKTASDILLDPSTRAPYDLSYTARMERKLRMEQMDSKRKLDREILESRESLAKKSRTVDTEQQRQRNMDIARLREEGMRELRDAQKRETENTTNIKGNALDTPYGLEGTLVVRWRKSFSCDKAYLTRILSPFNPDSILIKEGKKKHSAVVSFPSIKAAVFFFKIQNSALEALVKSEKDLTVNWVAG